jgi:hypothetical protein
MQADLGPDSAKAEVETAITEPEHSRFRTFMILLSIVTLPALVATIVVASEASECTPWDNEAVPVAAYANVTTDEVQNTLDNRLVVIFKLW